MLAPGSAAGRAGLSALLQDPGRALLALDFDGTLAPIVARPELARPAPGVVEVLTALTGRVGRVALITGRPAMTVVDLLGEVPDLVVLGQYGVQRWSGGALVEEPPVPGLELARPALAELAAGHDVVVEDKGHSLVLHSRQARDPEGALARLRPEVAALAARSGLSLHPGRLVLELRPPGHDKGLALLSLAGDVASVLCAGDDVGDLAAFDAVDHLRVKGVGGLLVCSDSVEAPEQLRTRADLVVPGPPGVVALLSELAAELS